MKRVLAAILALSAILSVGCREESRSAKSKEQIDFEKRLSAEISDHAVQIARLHVPAEGQAALAEAKQALAIAQLRMKELREASPKRWQGAQVFAVIAVEKLRKAHSDAKAAAVSNSTQPKQTNE